MTVENVIKKTYEKAKAEIRVINGYPNLYINDNLCFPYMLFVNSDMKKSKSINISQISRAAKYGKYNLYQDIFNLSVSTQDYEGNNKRLAKILDNIFKGDSEAYIVLRIKITGTNLSVYDDGDIVKYADGTYGDQISVASDKWLSNASDALTKIIKFVDNTPKYASRVIGYLLNSAETGEWFQLGYREKGIDISDANIKKYREWLFNKYKCSESLVTAWGIKDLTFENAYPPSDLCSSPYFSEVIETLYNKEFNSKYLDYQDYYNEMTVERIIHLAKISKEACDKEKIIGAFYGYSFELSDAKSGHYALNKSIDCEYIDFYASPVSYNDRNESGVAGSMGVVDSFVKHGKLWFDECDYRSPFVKLPFAQNSDVDGIPYYEPYIKTYEGLIEIYRRQFGNNMLTGKGGWIMDLKGEGWYDDDNFWKEMKKLKDLFLAYETIRPKKDPEVVLVLNEEGVAVSSDIYISVSTLLLVRDDLYRAGVNFGTYFLKDIENGATSESKLYIMLMPYRLASGATEKLAHKLQQNGKTVVWIYGFGCLERNDIKLLTGMNIKESSELSNLEIKLNGEGEKKFIHSNSLVGFSDRKRSPIWYVENEENLIIYGTSGNFDTFAAKKVKNSTQIFYGSYILKSYLIKDFASYAGAHIYAEEDDMLMANSNAVIMHTKTEGEKIVKFPLKTDVYSVFEKKWHYGIENIKFYATQAKTYIFIYGIKNEIENNLISKMEVKSWELEELQQQ